MHNRVYFEANTEDFVAIQYSSVHSKVVHIETAISIKLSLLKSVF